MDSLLHYAAGTIVLLDDLIQLYHSWYIDVTGTLKCLHFLPYQVQVFPLHRLDSKPCGVVLADKSLAAPAGWQLTRFGQHNV